MLLLRSGDLGVSSSAFAVLFVAWVCLAQHHTRLPACGTHLPSPGAPLGHSFPSMYFMMNVSAVSFNNVPSCDSFLGSHTTIPARCRAVWGRTSGSDFAFTAPSTCSHREHIVVDSLLHVLLLLLQLGAVAPSAALTVLSHAPQRIVCLVLLILQRFPHRLNLAFQLCGFLLLDTNLGLNLGLVLQGLLCNVPLEASTRRLVSRLASVSACDAACSFSSICSVYLPSLRHAVMPTVWLASSDTRCSSVASVHLRLPRDCRERLGWIALEGGLVATSATASEHLAAAELGTENLLKAD